MGSTLPKLFFGVGVLFCVLLAWSNQRDIARHDPRRTAGPNEVIVLTASWCGYCKAEKQALQAANVPFRELDVETDSEGRKAHQAVGGRGVPVTVIGKDVVFGYDAARLKSVLARHGYTASL